MSYVAYLENINFLYFIILYFHVTFDAYMT